LTQLVIVWARNQHARSNVDLAQKDLCDRFAEGDFLCEAPGSTIQFPFHTTWKWVIVLLRGARFAATQGYVTNLCCKFGVVLCSLSFAFRGHFPLLFSLHPGKVIRPGRTAHCVFQLKLACHMNQHMVLLADVLRYTSPGTVCKD
jgi:hypothetical protein